MMRTVALVGALAFGAAVPSTAPATASDRNTPSPIAATQARGREPGYKVRAGLDGEIFPALANYASLQPSEERTVGTVAVTVTNSTAQALKERIAVQVRGWSDEEIQMVEVAPGTERTYLFAPVFLPRLFRNREIAAATVRVQIRDAGGRLVHEMTAPVRLRSAEDIYWGDKFGYASFIASWVTPHAPEVEKVLEGAKEFMPGRRLAGYESWKSAAEQQRATAQQMKAIYRAVQAAGVSYVKSSMTLGGHESWSERVRLPGQSLRRGSANCIDGVVLYASLFENLGMQPQIVLVPGHAYVGVRAGQGSDTYLYLETALTGRASFERALRAGEAGVARYPESEIVRVKVADARAAGIYPLPEDGVAPAARTRGRTAASVL